MNDQKKEKEQSDSDWMREQRTESEHRRWFLKRIRGLSGWVIAAAWLFVDGIEKWDKFILWVKR